MVPQEAASERDTEKGKMLSYAAENGHEEAVKLLLDKDGVDVNSRDVYGGTPLSLAARTGHEAIVKLLLDKDGVDVNSRDKYGQTSLSLAVENGHEAIVELLLDKDGVDVNSQDYSSRTLLWLAARNGHEAIVKLLLDKDGVDVNSQDFDSRTPLSLAVEKGHEAIVKLLLDKDGVDVNSRDKYGQTPLSLAVRNGHEAIVKLLLDEDGVDVNSRDKYGQTPLSLAVEKGHEATVKLLLDKDGVDVNSSDKYGQTSLSLAVRNGHEAIVKLLLDEDGVDVNSQDYDSRTPLSRAVENGHEVIVKLLFDKDGVDVNSRDKYGQTLLSLAAEKGHKAIVKLLLDEDGVDVNSSDKYGQTSLSLAAKKGHEAIVKLLLDKDGVDVNSQDFDSRTPLSLAVENGHEAIVKLLLDKDGVDVNSRDKYGQTPLSRSVENGHEAIVKLLLDEDGVDVNSRDKYGQTPLSLAAEKGHEAIVKLLLDEDGVDVNSSDKYGQTSLSLAVRNGHEAIVKLLLDKDGGVDVNSQDFDSWTPLSLAVENGHEAIVKLLLDKDGVDVNSRDKYGQTPLSLAVENGHEAIVKLLLDEDGVDVNSRDKYGQTPLSLAAKKGHEAIVKLLLDEDGVDVNSRDKYGQTPLSLAAEKGHEAIVKLLLDEDGVDVNSSDKYGQTSLSLAVRNGHEAIVKLLLDKDGVYVNSQDYDGWTPLSRAVENGHEAVIELLLAKDDMCPDTKDGKDITRQITQAAGLPFTVQLTFSISGHTGVSNQASICRRSHVLLTNAALDNLQSLQWMMVPKCLTDELCSVSLQSFLGQAVLLRLENNLTAMVTIAEAAFNQLTGLVELFECLLSAIELTPQTKYRAAISNAFQLLWFCKGYRLSSLMLTTWTSDNALIVGIQKDGDGRRGLASELMTIIEWLSAILEPLDPLEHSEERFIIRHPLGYQLTRPSSIVNLDKYLELKVQVPSKLNTAEIDTTKEGCWRLKITGGVLIQATKRQSLSELPIRLGANDKNSLVLTAGALWSLFDHRLQPLYGCSCTFRAGENEFLACKKREKVPGSPDWYFWHLFIDPAELCNGKECGRRVSIKFTGTDRIHFTSPCVLGWPADTRAFPDDRIARTVEISKSFEKRKEISYSPRSFELQAQLGYSGGIQAQAITGITFDMKRYNVANSIPYDSILATALSEVATVLVYCEQRQIHLAMHGADLVEAICTNLLTQLLIPVENRPSFGQPCALERMQTWRGSIFVTSSGTTIPGAELVKHACGRIQELLDQTRSRKKPLYWSFRDILAGTECAGLKPPSVVNRTGWYDLSKVFPLLTVAVGSIEDKLLSRNNDPMFLSTLLIPTSRLSDLGRTLARKPIFRGGILSDSSLIEALCKQALSVYPTNLKESESRSKDIKGQCYLFRKAGQDEDRIKFIRCGSCMSASDTWPQAICLHYFY